MNIGNVLLNNEDSLPVCLTHFILKYQDTYLCVCVCVM